MSIFGIIYLLSRIVAIGAIVHVLLDNRQPSKTMAWVLVIYFFPIFGVVAYIIFGVNHRRERFISRRSMDQLTKRSMLGFVEQQDLQLPEAYKPLIDMFVNQSFSLPFMIDREVRVMTSGYEFFPALLRDIAGATSHVHVDMYIFEDDALGRLVADALIAKAKAGVEVRVIYDDVGSWAVKNRFYEHLREEGVEVEPFMPVRFPRFTSKANYRNHRKLVVIDGLVGYVGGMNLALRYVKGPKSKDGSAVWRDTMMRIEGAGVMGLQRAFLVDWYFVDRTLLSDKKYYPLSSHALSTPLPDGSATFTQMVTSGPSSAYPEIMQGYVRIILAAKRYVYIQSPYFLPTDTVLQALKTAATSGVDVRLMVPRYSDAWFVEWASRSYLREVVEAGAKVSLYEPGFLHSKLMVSDDVVSTCGSTNVDFRSFENNFEGNLFFYGEDVALKLRQVYLDDEARSTPLTSLPKRISPSLPARLGESLARVFSPLL